MDYVGTKPTYGFLRTQVLPVKKPVELEAGIVQPSVFGLVVVVGHLFRKVTSKTI